MLYTITSTVFKISVLLVAASAVVGLTITGHTLGLGGRLLAMGAILAAVIFGFQLAEGFGPNRLSIWAGPLWSNRQGSPSRRDNDQVRKAA